MISFSGRFVKRKSRQRERCRNLSCLLLPEGLTIGTLVLGGVHFMGAHQNTVQRAVVLVLAMVSALLDGTLDTLVGMTVHKKASFELDSELVWLGNGKVFWKRFPMLHFAGFCDMVNAT